MKILNMLRSENSYTDTQVGSLVACDDSFLFYFLDAFVDVVSM